MLPLPTLPPPQLIDYPTFLTLRSAINRGEVLTPQQIANYQCYKEQAARSTTSAFPLPLSSHVSHTHTHAPSSSLYASVPPYPFDPSASSVVSPEQYSLDPCTHSSECQANLIFLSAPPLPKNNATIQTQSQIMNKSPVKSAAPPSSASSPDFPGDLFMI